MSIHIKKPIVDAAHGQIGVARQCPF